MSLVDAVCNDPIELYSKYRPSRPDAVISFSKGFHSKPNDPLKFSDLQLQVELSLPSQIRHPL
jgi:hypothetical protein